MQSSVVNFQEYKNTLAEYRAKREADKPANKAKRDLTGFAGIKPIVPLDVVTFNENEVMEAEIEAHAVKLTENSMVGLFALGFGINDDMRRDLLMIKESFKSLLNRRFGRDHFLQVMIDDLHNPDPGPMAA